MANRLRSPQVMLVWFILGLLPARYLAKLVGFIIGGIFWHVTPVVAAIPESERRRYAILEPTVAVLWVG